MSNLVELSIEYYPDSDKGKPIGGGDLYVGVPDTDPTVVGNQVQVQALQENGSFVNMTQPITLSAGGVPLYNSSPVSLYVPGDYSLTVLDSNGSQVYYVPSTPGLAIIPGNYYYPDYSEADHGVTGNNGTIKYYVDQIGSDEATLYFKHNSGSQWTDYILSTAEVIGSNIKLEFEKGARLKPDNAISLTVYSPDHIMALDQQQIVDLTNNSTNPLLFTVAGNIPLEWYITNTTPGTTDMVNAFNIALLSGYIILNETSYAISDNIEVYSNSHIYGQGTGSIIKAIGLGVFHGITNEDHTNGNNNITLENFSIDMDQDGRGVGADGTSCGIYLLSDSATSKTNDNVRINKVTVTDTPHGGMYLFNMVNAQISENFINASLRDGIVIWRNSERVTLTDNIVVDAGDDCIAINSEGTNSGSIAKDVTIQGGILNQAAGATLGNGIRVEGGVRVNISGVIINYTQGGGIIVNDSFTSSTPAEDVSINNNILTNNGSAASGSGGIIVTNSTVNALVKGNLIINPYSDGILINGCEHAIVSDNKIVGNQDSSATGIIITGSAFGTVILDNTIVQSESYGINISSNDIKVDGNTIIYPCQTSITNAGIVVFPNYNRIDIINNRLEKDTGKATYGIRISTGTSTDILIIGNDVIGWTTGIISDGSSGTNRIRQNTNYITENSGTATLVSGTTSIAVTHNMSYTPDPSEIQVTPIETLGSASFWYVDTISSSTFTIRVNANPGADVDFAWQIIKN